MKTCVERAEVSCAVPCPCPVRIAARPPRLGGRQRRAQLWPSTARCGGSKSAPAFRANSQVAPSRFPSGCRRRVLERAGPTPGQELTGSVCEKGTQGGGRQGRCPTGRPYTGPEGGVPSRMCSVSCGGRESQSCDVTSPELAAAAPGRGSGCRSSAVRPLRLPAGGQNEVLVAPLSSRPCGAQATTRRSSATRASEQLLRAARRRRARDRQGSGCVYLRRSPYLRALRPPPAARRASGELRLRQRDAERLPNLRKRRTCSGLCARPARNERATAK